MANELEYVGASGLTVYAKPTPIVDTPWGGDDVALSEVATATGYYTANVGTPGLGYIVYSQAGGAPASSDTKLGVISVIPLLTKTAADAVQVTTDKIVFTVNNQVDSNIQSINDVTVTGNGVSPKWGP